MAKTVPYREIMKENGQNLGWCRPYKSNDGKIEIVVLENEIINKCFLSKKVCWCEM